MKEYDYLIVGAGLTGAMAAYHYSQLGKNCLVVEKKPYVGGFCHTRRQHGIEVHKFGAHIFRTNEKRVWDFVNSICPFIPFVNQPIANYRGQLYSLPFNMNTFYTLFGAKTPSEAMSAIENDKEFTIGKDPENMEEAVLAIAGRKIYETLIKGYSEKQWGRPCSELPPDTMSHVPLRMTFDNNYYDVKYQGIPECGYTEFISRLLENSDVMLRTDYFKDRKQLESLADRIVYTGRIDQFFDFCFGELEYRSVKFDEEWHPNTNNYQGVAVMNYTDNTPLYTRIIEHKHFASSSQTSKGTILSFEYPCLPDKNCAPIYPVRNNANINLLNAYKELASKHDNVEFVGQLADYMSYNMSHIIEKFI